MIRVLHVGLGQIGAAVVRQVAARSGLRIVGAVDVDPNKVGLDVGTVCEVGQLLGIKVVGDIANAIKTARPDIAVLCTHSSLRRVFPEFEQVLRSNVAIVSTTEELAYPVSDNKSVAARIDALAREANVAVLGTGVNPGFLMDALPIALTAVCERVSAIEVDRIQDATIRRRPFQLKIGSGLTPEQFARRVEEGSVRHVGLAESVTMIADALGWTLERVTDEIRPKIAELRVSSEFLTVEPGTVCGLVQDGIGFQGGRPIIKLHMEAYLGAPESYDAIRISGRPSLNVKVSGGVHGDIATASITVNSIPKVLNAAPGLRTMRDTALPSFYNGQ